MKRIAAVCLLASFAVATVYGKTVVGGSSASNSSVSIKEMSMSDLEKAFGGSGFGGSFSGNGVGFGNVVKSYTGKPSVVLKECCVYPPMRAGGLLRGQEARQHRQLFDERKEVL